jgi:hypothetical protein
MRDGSRGSGMRLTNWHHRYWSTVSLFNDCRGETGIQEGDIFETYTSTPKITR